jgi:integrase
LDWETEVRALEAFKPSAHDKIFLEEFLFRCYTGLRHSDVYNINGANFIRRGNDIYLDFTSIKTKVDQNLRLTQKAVKVLEGWKFNPPRLHIDKCNLAIKRICKAAGINSPTEKVRFSGSKRKADVHEKHELMATHVARRTFGRRWMENGGTLMRLSIFYGHSSEKITSKYIGWTTDEVNDEMSRVID